MTASFISTQVFDVCCWHIAAFQKLTPRAIMNKALLETEIQTGIRRGWHVSRGENEPDTIAVAVPVVTANDVFVLVVAGIKTRMERKIAHIGAKLRDAMQMHQMLYFAPTRPYGQPQDAHLNLTKEPPQRTSFAMPVTKVTRGAPS